MASRAQQKAAARAARAAGPQARRPARAADVGAPGAPSTSVGRQADLGGPARTTMTRRGLRNTMRVIGLIGLGIATYLTVVHYGGLTVLCTTKNNSCAQVQASAYSHIAGIPVALLGLIGYLAILVTLLVPESEPSRLATLAITLFGFGFSMYLTGREVFTLQEICEWCVGSATLMTILLGLSLYRYLRPPAPSQPPPSPR
jgi:uncharacterized membrane protein